MTLQGRLVRLAYHNPRLRDRLLPLLTKQAGASKRARAGKEAEAAFAHEIAPFMQNFISQAQRQIADAILDIEDGKWPNKRMEYGVMRYKPMSMTDQDFREEIVNAYLDWVRNVTFAR